VSIVVQGAIKFEVEGREVTVRAGEVLVIPSNLPHNALALEDSSVIEIFSPIRLDWMTGKDNYLRK
jgi:unsaturated pyranuronate lyase